MTNQLQQQQITVKVQWRGGEYTEYFYVTIGWGPSLGPSFIPMEKYEMYLRPWGDWEDSRIVDRFYLEDGKVYDRKWRLLGS